MKTHWTYLRIQPREANMIDNAKNVSSLGLPTHAHPRGQTYISLCQLKILCRRCTFPVVEGALMTRLCEHELGFSMYKICLRLSCSCGCEALPYPASPTTSPFEVCPTYSRCVFRALYTLNHHKLPLLSSRLFI